MLAPCALGGAIDAATSTRCAARSSAARPTTSSPTSRWPIELHERGIIYAPDFIANAGGLINVYAELHPLDRARTKHLVDGIGETIAHLLTEADERGATPLEAARELAAERLERARRREPAAA